ncbi:MAG: helicase-exonuclease AddAB subunit AddA [Clostridia bacterium]|nr:helicase-exonuclease AddAB subunit AddA [Clostridia bacterium]
MAERIWTKEQNDAITSRGGTLLLSAAAGSGKTAVLVERIIKLMTEGSEPVSPENLLVVTFTNAAAAEMRTRINNSVDKLISENPSDSFLRNVRMKLPEAKITTMDSFCMGLVREHFHIAEIEPDFTMLDNSEAQILISEAMNAMYEKMCTENPEVYDILNSATSYYGDDESLSGKILRLYNYSLSHPFPDLWLDSIQAMYDYDGDITQSVWGKIILEEIKRTADYSLSLVKDALSIITADEVLENHYRDTYEATLLSLEKAIDIINYGGWDEIYNCLQSFSFLSPARAPRGYGKDPIKLAAESNYKLAEKLMGECSKSICTDSQGNASDMAILRPVIKGLIDAVRDFRTNYNELKKARNSYTFTDIMHKTLSLLIKAENGEIRKTALAYDLQQTYREILIDEYQDTNEAQDMLFATLSRNNTNMFMVGDVKQSIYRFRLAMPEIFVKKSREYHDFDNENYPARIILGRNFRSRKGVLDNINFLFRNIMSDYVGEMEYTDRDALYYGEGYDEDTEPAVELRLLRTKSRETEARYIASLIRKMIDEGATVYENKQRRKAVYSDFCILLRSTSGKTGIYEEALKELNIPVSCEKKSGLFSCVETGIFLSLLKTINNPTDDVALLTVMFSPLYGFTADDAAEVKLYGKKKNLYSCLKDASADIKKAKTLLDDLSYYRKTAAVMPVDTFIRTLLDTTGYMSVVSALENGETKKLNLLMLCSIASDFVSKGGTDLGRFIRYVNKITSNGEDISAASDASANSSAVKILSIHKSKGLEFPFIILADCAKSFNKNDTSAEMIISSDAGVGIKITNGERFQSYTTLGHRAARLAVKRSTSSEEMRILYVAMTRAREKFIAVGSVTKPEDAVSKAVNAYSGSSISPCAVLNADSYLKWLLMGYITHPDMRPLTEQLSFLSVSDFKNADSRLKVVIDEPEETESEETDEEIHNTLPDEAIIELIREKVSFVYPYDIPSSARPKKIASDFEEKRFNAEHFAKTKPDFMHDKKLTPAQQGTANHLFLQNLDFTAESIEAELMRMRNQGLLTEKQADAIRTDKVKAFIRSDIFARIKNAEKVMREKEFTVQIKLGDIDSTVADNVKDEKFLVLGKADLVFIENNEAVVVDYKTDRRKTENDFIAAYAGQLDMYRRAMEQILDIPVKETLIYSLELEKTIEIS